LAVRNDLSGLLAFIGSKGDGRERLQDTATEHLVPTLEEFVINRDGLVDLLGEQWSGLLRGCGSRLSMARP